MVTEPRILFLDIETAPNVAYVWGLFDQNISHEHLETASYILCWSAKWSGQRRILFSSVYDHKPRTMLAQIHRLLDQADVVVHYNGLKFDIPTLNKEFLKHGFQPPSPYKQVDVLRVCRGAFRFESNKLDAVLKALDLGAKVKHRGFSLWLGCIKGDPACWREMKRYNRHDVRSLERLYTRILPWIERHPNLSVFNLEKPACSNCGSTKVQQRGKMVAITHWFPRYHCQACGRWFRGVVQKKKRA